MSNLNLWEAELVVASAIFARNVYHIKFQVGEYCSDHDLDPQRMSEAIARMSRRRGAIYLEAGEDDRLRLTEDGLAFLINDLDWARDLVMRISDGLAIMALDASLTSRVQQQQKPTIAKDVPKPASYPTFEAAFANEENRSAMCRMLRRAYEELDRSTSSNAQIAQAKAYIECALMMTECPEPQPDLVWEFCQRAGNIAGIGSLILAIIALVVAA